MPVEFDPAWEYRVDDPEVVEVLNPVKLPRPLTFVRPEWTKEYVVEGFQFHPVPRSPRSGLRVGVGDVAGQLAAMWDAGLPVPDIARALGVTECSIVRWRKVLRLTPRPVGNHSASRMKATVI